MDRQLIALDRHQHDHLDQVAGTIGSDDEPTVRIVAEIADGLRVIDGVDDVLIVDAVSTRRRMDLDTAVSYYES